MKAKSKSITRCNTRINYKASKGSFDQKHNSYKNVEKRTVIYLCVKLNSVEFKSEIMIFLIYAYHLKNQLILAQEDLKARKTANLTFTK